LQIKKFNKIIGEGTDYFAQGYFVLRFKKIWLDDQFPIYVSDQKNKITYLITVANFIACHQQVFLEKLDMLREAMEGSTFC